MQISCQMGNSNYNLTRSTMERKSDDIFNQNYKGIKSKCLQTGRLFEDETFPANWQSLFMSQPPQSAQNLAVKWLRPTEICKDPKFFSQGSSRFDLVQGELGDCWVIAAVATLADHSNLLKQVVPTDQSYDKGNYAGVFLFRFFYFGKWVEICVDDRLPTYENKLLMVHSSETIEFWGALLEKAYAKLFGCYETLQGGVSSDALSDFTGGVVETYRLKEDAQVNLAEMLVEAVARGSMACAGIWGDNRQNPVLDCGLVVGHAYTIVAAEKIRYRNAFVTLVQVRNPWGNEIEWNGPWSDSSKMWADVSADVVSKLKRKISADGDFWMDVMDFIKYFDDVDICNLTPDSVETNKLCAWNTLTYYGSWTRGQTAGGRLKYKTFAINPQYAIDLVDSTDDADVMASVVVELSQKPQRNRPQDHLDIGFLLYKVSNNEQIPVSNKFFDQNTRAAGVDYYSNLRTVTKRFSLKPGKYIIISSTWEPGQEGSFLLRVWSESQLKSSKSNVRVTSPQSNFSRNSKLEDDETSSYAKAINFFKSLAGEDLQINVFDLQNGLNHLYACSEKYYFDIDCCRMMIFMFDVGGHYKLNLDQFLNLFQVVDKWTVKFKSYDQNLSGYLNFISYTICVMELNFVDIDKKLLNYLSFRYGDTAGRVSYTNFIHSLIKLSTLGSLEAEFGDVSEVDNVDGFATNTLIRSVALKF